MNKLVEQLAGAIVSNVGIAQAIDDLIRERIAQMEAERDRIAAVTYGYTPLSVESIRSRLNSVWDVA